MRRDGYDHGVKLILMYGPPAVGKLTTATELSRRAGYRLFHNHLTVPVVEAIFPEESPQRNRLLKTIRLNAIEAAAEAGQNLIFTTGYSGTHDDQFIHDIVQAVTRHHGMLHFVQLTAPRSVLMERVKNPSRQEHAKMVTPAQLELWLDTPHRDAFASMPIKDVLLIDTSTGKPSDTATTIMDQFEIKERQEL